jgi:endonuclease/exonuclease/phosphatase family metal-dependent hydrolase
MRIYSWNVLRSNRNLEELYSFIEELDFDVLCLQEVTQEMLERLQKMKFHVAHHVDRYAEVVHFFKKNVMEVNYVVILSKHEILKVGQIEFPTLLDTFRSRVFSYFMGLLRKWEAITNLGSVYADIKIQDKVIRIFSVHLALWNPKTREREFNDLVKYLPEKGSAIIAGDFNILEFGPIKILNWLLGGSIREGMPWYPERRLFEERFARVNLQNPLLGKITHKFSRSQLDHILTSKDLHLKNAWVVSDSHGSDHQPVGLDVEI